MSFYGVWENWKIVYTPINSTGGHAMQVFREQNAGEFFVVNSIKKLFDCV